MRKAETWVDGLLLGLLFVALVLGMARLDRPQYPDCAYEDGSGSSLPCVWHADRQGNHKGHDVLITEEP